MATLVPGNPVLHTLTCATTLHVARALSDDLPASVDEIAQATSLPLGTVESALHHLLELRAVSHLPGGHWQRQTDGLRRAAHRAYAECGFEAR